MPKKTAFSGADHRQAPGVPKSGSPRGSRRRWPARRSGVTEEQTYYRWRKHYGGLRLDQAKLLKQLEMENVLLKMVVADLTLDNAILKEAAEGNF